MTTCKTIIVIVLLLSLSRSTASVDLKVNGGMVVRTFIGSAVPAENEMGMVRLDGDVLDNPFQSYSGYLIGKVSTTNRSSVDHFAGMALSSPLIGNATIRRITRLKYEDNQAPTGVFRYYRTIHDGATVTANMEMAFAVGGTFDEADTLDRFVISNWNGVEWFSYEDAVATSSPVYAENVTIDPGQMIWIISWAPEYAKIFAKIFLEGPYRFAVSDPGHPGVDYMATKLRHAPRSGSGSSSPPNFVTGDCVIPVVSPYPDSLSRDTGVSDRNELPENIVDWVYLQLRPGDRSGRIGRELLMGHGFHGVSCFLRNDGFLCDLDGSPGVTVPGVTDGRYFLIIDSRNHLKVMSADSIQTRDLTDITEGNYYDFTESADRYYWYGNPNHKGIHSQPVNGKWLVAAGDVPLYVAAEDTVRKNHQVENFDYDAWFSSPGAIGYTMTDFDMGIQIEGRDTNLWNDNVLVRSPFSWPEFRNPEPRP